MKIINIIGTRPNFMKMAPIIREMNKHKNINHLLLHTGQHYDYKMSQLFFDELGLPEPDIHLNIGSDTQTAQVAKIMIEFEKVCDEIKPDAILVVGDVNSTMACTLVAAKKGIKTFHVEAGIRSNDKSMPEEINRLVTDSISDYLLPPSQDAVENLKNEGHKNDKIELVGNVMIDSLFLFADKIDNSKILDQLGLIKGEFAVVTLHRPSNVDNSETFLEIINALEYLQNSTKIVFPLHPRTRKMLIQFDFMEKLESLNNIIITDSLGYLDFGKLVKNAKLVLTDSGGIQEETTVYTIPCITIRENTERPITITEGTNVLAGSDYKCITKFIDDILKNKWKVGKTPEYWDGQAAKRIVEFLLTLDLKS